MQGSCIQQEFNNARKTIDGLESIYADEAAASLTFGHGRLTEFSIREQLHRMHLKSRIITEVTRTSAFVHGVCLNGE